MIKDQRDMENLLKFLIYNLNTIDGRKDSSLPIQQLCKSTVSLLTLKHELMLKTMTKYKILTIRNKLSFTAFMKKQTINEVILTQITFSHKKLL